MNYDDFATRFNEIVSHPDTGLSQAPDILADVKGVFESNTALAEKVTALEQRVKDLQESNVKLYLATTGTAPDEDNDELDESDGEEFIDSIFNKVKED